MKLRPLVVALMLGACMQAAPFAGPGPKQPVSTVSSDILGTASVIDGDTVDIHGRRIRLFGVDAPESRQTCVKSSGEAWRCGAAAANALADHIGRRPISCVQRDTDRYGRVVAVCSVGGEDLGAWLVRQGWAVAYRQYASDYIGDETAARTARRGIWSGQFDLPSDWRKAQRTKAEAVGPAPAVRLLKLASSYSCSPRKYCKQMSSCDEARWALENCSWGPALDRDGDGVPCETICSGG